MPAAKKLRLSTVITAMTYGGAQRIIIDLHRVMPDFIEPEVIGIYPGGMTKFLLEQNVPVTEFDYRGKNTWKGIPALVAHYRKHRPDVVMTHLGKADFVGRAAARLTRVPIVISCIHNMDDWKEKPLLNWLDNQSLRMADGILCVSKAAKNYLVKHGQHPDRIRVSHDRGELRDRFRDNTISDAQRRAYRDEFHISDDTLVSIMVGRMYPQKAHEVMLRALAALVKEDLGRPHVVLIPGDGPQRAEQEALARELLPAESYRFLGNRDDIPALLAFSDVYVMPSRWEGTPLALQEAFACGLPAIVSDIPSMSEVVEDCQGALIFPVEDHAAMAREWKRMLLDPELRRELGARARDKAFAHWDIRNLRDEYFKYLAEVCLQRNTIPRAELPKGLLDFLDVETFCK
jgi:glycosyltransferase involved in cell wall biosynthesis